MSTGGGAAQLHSGVAEFMGPSSSGSFAVPVDVKMTAEQMADCPPNTCQPGDYAMCLEMPKPQEPESKKTIAYVFEPDTLKLYARSSHVEPVVCPLEVHLCRPPPEGAMVRVQAVYVKPEHVNEVVQRCLTHIAQDKDKFEHAEHFVRCENASASYHTLGQAGRQSVCFPFRPREPSRQNCAQGDLKFMCFNSCPGINRRQIKLIVTLEHSGTILGRRAIDLKVCACPGRDANLPAGRRAAAQQPAATDQFKHEQGDFLVADGVHAGRVAGAHAGGAVKRRADHNPTIYEKVTRFTTMEPRPAADRQRKATDDEIFTIQVRGRELYKIVKAICVNYEMARQYEDMLAAASAIGAAASAHAQISNVIRTWSLETPVDRLLTHVHLPYLVPILHNAGYRNLADFGDTLNDKQLAEAGVQKEEERSAILGAFVQFKWMLAESQMSSLETVQSQPSDHSAGSKRPPAPDRFGSNLSQMSTTSSLGSGGPFRVSKTTVRHTYHVNR